MKGKGTGAPAEAVPTVACAGVSAEQWVTTPLRKVMFAKEVMTLTYRGTGPFLSYQNLVHDPEYQHPWKAEADHEEYARFARAQAIALTKSLGLPTEYGE